MCPPPVRLRCGRRVCCRGGARAGAARAAGGDDLTPLSCLCWQVGLLLNNAAIPLKGASWGGVENWRKIFDVNLFGYVLLLAVRSQFCQPIPSSSRTDRVLNVQHTFVPNMLHQENPAVIINTGSKQGITNPP